MQTLLQTLENAWSQILHAVHVVPYFNVHSEAWNCLKYIPRYTHTLCLLSLLHPSLLLYKNIRLNEPQTLRHLINANYYLNINLHHPHSAVTKEQEESDVILL